MSEIRCSWLIRYAHKSYGGVYHVSVTKHCAFCWQLDGHDLEGDSAVEPNVDKKAAVTEAEAEASCRLTGSALRRPTN